MTIKELDDKLNSPGFQDTENGDLFYNFFVYQYPADKEYDIRRQIQEFKENLIRPTNYVDVLTLNLFDEFCDFLDQKKFLKAQEAQAIDEFVASGSLPKKVDDFFVKSINALLKGFEPVVIDTDDLIKKLEEMPPMDEASFKAKVNEIVSAYTKGKDTSKLRIVVKRRESEE